MCEQRNDVGVGSETPMREMTVDELLERRIERARLQVKALTDLRDNLPQAFLRSGASRVLAFIEPH